MLLKIVNRPIRESLCSRKKSKGKFFSQILLFIFFENIACLTSEEVSLIGAHNFDEENEYENNEEWVAPYEE